MVIVKGGFRLSGRQIHLILLVASIVTFAATFLSTGWGRKVDPAAPVRRAPLRLVRLDRAGGRARMAELMDPSLMALPNGHGFSGRSWSSAPQVGYVPVDSTVSPSTLPAPPASPLPVLLRPAELTTALQSGLERVSADMDGGAHNTLPATLERSVFQVSGGLEGWTVVKSPALEAVVSAVALRPTWVRVGVGSDGVVRFAVLERSCGQEEVDGRALEWARGIRFEPLAGSNGAGVQWGVVKFLWATQLPARP